MNSTTDNQQFNDSLHFVASHYKEHAFVAPHMSFCTLRDPVAWLRRHAVAAVVAAVSVIAVSACALYVAFRPTESAPSEAQVTPASVEADPAQVKRLEFADADLHEVIAEIQSTYNVTIVNVPGVMPGEKSYRLTLSYEGTADDLIDTINSLLDLNLEIVK